MAVGPIANVMPWEDPIVEEGRNRYYGEYLGFVRDREDSARLGRVKVHVPAILGDEDVDEHWIECVPKGAGLNVPPIGAPVVVTFEQGYVSHGFYTHGWILGSDPKTSKAPLAGKGELDPTWQEERQVANGGAGPSLALTIPADTARTNLPKYPYNKVYQSEGGHVLEMDDTPGFPRVRYYHPSGTMLFVDADGSVHVNSVGAQWFQPGGDFVVALKQGATFKVVYPGGSGLTVGAQGVHAVGHAVSLMGRAVTRRETDVN